MVSKGRVKTKVAGDGMQMLEFFDTFLPVEIAQWVLEHKLEDFIDEHKAQFELFKRRKLLEGV